MRTYTKKPLLGNRVAVTENLSLDPQHYSINVELRVGVKRVMDKGYGIEVGIQDRNDAATRAFAIESK